MAVGIHQSSVAMLYLVGQTWQPLFVLFVQNITYDILIGWSCTGDWQPRTISVGGSGDDDGDGDDDDDDDSESYVDDDDN